jgi:hypothetical protein
MRTRIRNFAFALLALAAGCTASSDPNSAESGVAPPRTAMAPKIVDIVSRDNVVTINAGAAGPLYTARTRSGHVLFADATLDQVQTFHPDVYHQINGTAAAGAEHVIDASVDLGSIGDSN